MGEEQKSARFQELRQRQQENRLVEAEQAELAALIRELEAGEAAYLTPATERLRREREAREAQNHALEKLILRKVGLLRRLRTFLDEARAERRAIASELATVLAGGPGSETEK